MEKIKDIQYFIYYLIVKKYYKSELSLQMVSVVDLQSL